MPGLVLTPDPSTEISHQIECLRRSTQETGDELRKMEQEQESFALQYHECTKVNGMIRIINRIHICLFAILNNFFHFFFFFHFFACLWENNFQVYLPVWIPIRMLTQRTCLK